LPTGGTALSSVADGADEAARGEAALAIAGARDDVVEGDEDGDDVGADAAARFEGEGELLQLAATTIDVTATLHRAPRTGTMRPR
jgi:hypothetical protein